MDSVTCHKEVGGGRQSFINIDENWVPTTCSRVRQMRDDFGVTCSVLAGSIRFNTGRS